jgi:hypothetical protein
MVGPSIPRGGGRQTISNYIPTGRRNIRLSCHATVATLTQIVVCGLNSRLMNRCGGPTPALVLVRSGSIVHKYGFAVTRPLRTQSKRGAVPGGPARPRSEIPFPVQRFSRANSTATGNRRKSTRTNNDKAFLVLLFGSSWVARAGEPAQNQHSSSACLRKRSGHFCGFATHRQLKSFSN